MERVLEKRLGVDHTGKTIKTLLTRELRLSDGLIDDLKKHADGILLNGKSARVTERLSAGDTLTLRFRDEEKSSVVPNSGPVDIVYEDEDILLINKPARLPCHPVSGNRTQTLANYLVFHYASRGRCFTPRVITRLDSGTSGLVLLAKNPLSGSLLGSAAAMGELKKEYLAVTVGVPNSAQGVINAPIRRMSKNAIKREVCAPGEGQAAVTGYELLAQSGKLSLLRVFPKTGRTHQIRVHLSSIGCPLAGDFLYGEEDAALISRPALHMERISFTHPLTGETLGFEAALPEDMRALISEPEGDKI